MKIKLKAKLLTVLAIITLGVTWVVLDNTDVYADDGSTTSLIVSPMTQQIILIPGETYTGTIDIFNGVAAKKDIEYSAQISPYNIKGGDNSKDDYSSFSTTESTDKNMMVDWTSIDKTNGRLSPNEKTTLTYTIRVPKDAPAGSQYIAILVTNETPKDNPENSKNAVQITSKTQLASAIIANVAGETVEKGAIKNNDMPSMLTTNNLEATSMVRNDGNIYTDASYTLQVWPMFSDEEICTNEENPETSTILPGTERYHTQTCTLPAVGIFKAKQTVKIFDEVSILEKTIFVCPIWLMVIVLLVVIGIIVAITVYVKKRHSAKEIDD